MSSSEGFWAAGKQFFRRNPGGFQGNVRYVSPENFSRIGAENFRGDEALKKEFYRCIGSFYISPDSFEWSITDGWLEGLG